MCTNLTLCFRHRMGAIYGFSCDICGVIGGSGKCWLYRCGFDAHLSCATSKPQENLFLNQINQWNQILQAIMMAYGGNVNNRLLQQMIGGGNMNNQILQAILGGGGGSNQLHQALIGGGGDLIQGLPGGSSGGLDLSSVLGNVGGLMGAGLGGFGF
ncbi:hypothetical protein L1987_00456 [Smallanthus sonchifolius]|uniref:Uncharacterized protein n=1 Tax=Smallanthus sonchifolius TaxID=185202 RepID=A0ACB9K2A7_9ASTR|nr:hypothetical protein L1987_00456 [Smallanthus sonchifolius]